MKKLILVAIITVFAAVGVAFAASGDKKPTFAPKAGTPANSTAASIAAGELQYNASYLYINVSTAARPHWRRIAVGSGF